MHDVLARPQFERQFDMRQVGVDQALPRQFDVFQVRRIREVEFAFLDLAHEPDGQFARLTRFARFFGLRGWRGR